MNKSTDISAKVAPAGAVATAVAVAASGMSVTFIPTVPYGTTGTKVMATMTPQDSALIDAKIQAKLAEQRGDLRLNTQGLSDLKERFGDLSAKMAGVPADISAMKRDIAHLPSKDELGNKLRNYLAFAVSVLGVMIAAATFFIKNVLDAAG